MCRKFVELKLFAKRERVLTCHFNVLACRVAKREHVWFKVVRELVGLAPMNFHHDIARLVVVRQVHEPIRPRSATERCHIEDGGMSCATGPYQRIGQVALDGRSPGGSVRASQGFERCPVDVLRETHLRHLLAALVVVAEKGNQAIDSESEDDLGTFDGAEDFFEQCAWDLVPGVLIKEEYRPVFSRPALNVLPDPSKVFLKRPWQSDDVLSLAMNPISGCQKRVQVFKV